MRECEKSERGSAPTSDSLTGCLAGCSQYALCCDLAAPMGFHGCVSRVGNLEGFPQVIFKFILSTAANGSSTNNNCENQKKGKEA